MKSGVRVGMQQREIWKMENISQPGLLFVAFFGLGGVEESEG